MGVGAAARRCDAVVAVGVDGSADGTWAPRASNRRPRDGTAFTDGIGRELVSRSRTAWSESRCCFPLVDPPSLRSTSGSMITLSSRNRADDDEKNRAWCARPRCRCAIRPTRIAIWRGLRSRCPLSALGTGAVNHEGLAVAGHLHRRSSLDRDAGHRAAVRPVPRSLPPVILKTPSSPYRAVR